MLKLLASGLIVAASSGLGFAVADGYRHRPRQLRQLQFALTVLGSEIRFRQTPLPQGLQAVASAVGGPVGQLFADLAAVLARAQGRSVSWAWQQVKPCRGLALSSRDQDLLARLTQVLGAGTVGEQIRQLELHMEHLQQLEQEAERARTANEKIWRYLGVFSGIALVLILL
ncbi:MAG: hypothetical protein ACOX21_09420 [Bacillota bacterium]|jgi:stage III sporulation protein AB|nr:hypothetical protein [Bacillota bacterium]HPZ21424.1 hypothetical protein [Bacillota bacterium]HQD19285.1 hypothetical protein [Bacillota bacterium]